MAMLALVLADIPIFGFNVVSCLGAAGVRCDVMATHHRSLCRWSRYCRRFVEIDRVRLLTQDRSLADEVAAYARARGVGAVVPADLESALLLATHRDCFEAGTVFPLSSPDVLRALHDKASFAAMMERAGVEQPRTVLLESARQLDGLALRYPVVVKAPASSWGYGVWVAPDRRALEEYLRSAQAELPRLVQEHVPGSDVDLTVLCDHGRVVAWVIQRRTADGGAEFFHDEAVLEVGRRAAAHAGIHGIADFDLRLDGRDGRVKMIECNPRFPGSLLFKLWAGVNLVQLGVVLAQGGEVDEMFHRAQGRCTDVAIAPRRLLRTLARGHIVPPELPECTRRCWSMNLRDPLPHLIRAWQGSHGRGPGEGRPRRAA